MKHCLMILLSSLLLVFNGCRHSENDRSEATKESVVQEFERIYAATGESYGRKDFRRYNELSRQVLEFSPLYPGFLYQYAKSFALIQNEKESLKHLRKLVGISGTAILSIETDDDFTSLFENRDFKNLVESARQKIQPVNNSEVAFIIKEKDLIPEGVAYDTETDRLFISSIYRRKIVMISPDGRIQDFIGEKQDGILAVIGMEADPVRRHLWMCSAFDGSSEILDIEQTKDKRSSVYKYDLDSARLIKKYVLNDTTSRFFNDLTIHVNGDVYITDWFAGEVYRISVDNDRLELFTEPSEFLYPNGIALSDDGNILFIAHLAGIHKINLESREKKKLRHPEDITLVSIDGLAFYNNALIAHQGSSLGGVFLYTLNASQDRVVSKKAVEVLNPLFDFPTTGELAADTYYYIANAQLRRFDQDGTIFPLDKLEDVYILKTDLRDF